MSGETPGGSGEQKGKSTRQVPEFVKQRMYLKAGSMIGTAASALGWVCVYQLYRYAGARLFPLWASTLRPQPTDELVSSSSSSSSSDDTTEQDGKNGQSTKSSIDNIYYGEPANRSVVGLLCGIWTSLVVMRIYPTMYQDHRDIISAKVQKTDMKHLRNVAVMFLRGRRFGTVLMGCMLGGIVNGAIDNTGPVYFEPNSGVQTALQPSSVEEGSGGEEKWQ